MKDFFNFLLFIFMIIILIIGVKNYFKDRKKNKSYRKSSGYRILHQSRRFNPTKTNSIIEIDNKSIPVDEIYDWYFDSGVVNGNGVSLFIIYYNNTKIYKEYRFSTSIFGSKKKYESVQNNVNHILQSIVVDKVFDNFLKHVAYSINTKGKYKRDNIVFLGIMLKELDYLKDLPYRMHLPRLLIQGLITQEDDILQLI